MTKSASQNVSSTTSVATTTARKTKPKAQPTPIVVESISAVVEPIPDTLAQPSKPALITTLLHRPHGASMSELMQASGWQAHSVRGLISGSLRKKQGLIVTRFKSETGETAYRIDAPNVAR